MIPLKISVKYKSNIYLEFLYIWKYNLQMNLISPKNWDLILKQNMMNGVSFSFP